MERIPDPVGIMSLMTYVHTFVLDGIDRHYMQISEVPAHNEENGDWVMVGEDITTAAGRAVSRSMFSIASVLLICPCRALLRYFQPARFHCRRTAGAAW